MSTATDRDRLYEEPPDNVRFLMSMFASNREEDFVLGIKAFVTEWFYEFSDEQNLPMPLMMLIDLAEQWFDWDLSEITGGDDDE